MRERPRVAPVATLLCLAVLASCGGAGPRPAPPPRVALGPLARLVPAGASVVVVAHPDAVWAAPTARAVVEALVSVPSLDEFATRTGVDPRRLTEAVVAEYAGGTVVVVRGPFVAREIVLQAEVRMSVVESRSDAPWLRRGGLFGNEHRDVVALGDDVLAVASDVEALSGLLACAEAQRRPGTEGCRPALATPDALALLEAGREAPAVLVAPDHLELPPGFGTSVLLAEERALAVTAIPGPEAIAFTVELRGDFPPGADANFRSLAESMSRTELGGVLGLEDALPTLLVSRGPAGVRLSARLPPASIQAALRALFGGQIREILAPRAAIPTTH